MTRTMNRFDQLAELLAMASIMAAGVILTAYGSLL